MTQEISKHVAEIAGLISAAYPNWKPTKETLAAWTAILDPGDPVALRQATLSLLRQARPFPPSPGEILTACQPPAPDPLEAWGEVQHAVRCLSSEPKWSHPLIGRAVYALGGFKLLEAELGEATRASYRARFVDAMKSMPDHDRAQDAYELAAKATDGLLGALERRALNG